MTTRLNDTFDLTLLKDELTTDEGYKNHPYKDTAGKLTIGIGHNLDEHGISNAVLHMIFMEDIERVCADLDEYLPWWRDLPQKQQRVVANLCFNLGWPRLSQFKVFLHWMQRGNWERAADELMDSKWWGQVGFRGPRMIGRLTGDPNYGQRA